MRSLDKAGEDRYVTLLANEGPLVPGGASLREAPHVLAIVLRHFPAGLFKS